MCLNKESVQQVSCEQIAYGHCFLKKNWNMKDEYGSGRIWRAIQNAMLDQRLAITNSREDKYRTRNT